MSRYITPNCENQCDRKGLPATSLITPLSSLEFSTLNRSIFQSTAPPRIAPTAQTPAQKMTALWFCWPQTPAARAPKLENTTIAIVAAAAQLFLLSPPNPCPPCRASASVLAPKNARLAAAPLALLLRRSDWSPPSPWCPPPSARSVPAAPCLQVAG